MKSRKFIKSFFLVCLLLVTSFAGLMYYAGCVVIPEHPFVISGKDDMEVKRSHDGCDSGRGFEGGALTPDGISVLSWNSHKGSHEHFGKDLLKLAENVELLLLQEVAFDESLKGQLGILARQWLAAVAFELGETEVGLLSVSRVAAGSSCAFREPEPLLVIPKMILAATYPIAGQENELLAVNIHVVNFTIGNEAILRQVSAISELIVDHRGPVIVAGDFNTWSKSRENTIKSLFTELGLQPVRFDPDNRSHFFNRAVDGIYYRDLELTRAVSHKVETSDHNPLEAHFRIKVD